MKLRLDGKRKAQLIVVLLGGAALKLYYSAATVNQLRWILAPTTLLVELISRTRFEFESHAGYMSSDHTFLIAASCAGVNFLITAFLMLSLGGLWRNRSRNIPWRFIPATVLFAYLATIVANTVRISTALQLRDFSLGRSQLSFDEVHRFEGIFIYFGFLLLLFLVSEKLPFGKRTQPLSPIARTDFLPRALFPVLVYYGVTLGIPVANGAYRQGMDFWEHSVFVLVTPWLLILPLAVFRFCKERYVETKLVKSPGKEWQSSHTITIARVISSG